MHQDESIAFFDSLIHSGGAASKISRDCWLDGHFDELLKKKKLGHVTVTDTSLQTTLSHKGMGDGYFTSKGKTLLLFLKLPKPRRKNDCLRST